MIKEIPFPLQSISEILNERLKPRKPRKIKERKSFIEKLARNNYVSFERDPTFVEEFSEATGVSKEFAEEFLIVFFDEIKSFLLKGNIISFCSLGCFYIGKSNVNRFDTRESCIDNVRAVYPKFRASSFLRKLLKAIYGKDDVPEYQENDK
jgi:nucleoid DNA-binding protein